MNHKEIKEYAKVAYKENRKYFSIAGFLSVMIPVAAMLIRNITVSLFVIFFAYVFFSLILTKMSMKVTAGEELEKRDIYDISGGKGLIITTLWRLLYFFICYIPALFVIILTSTLMVADKRFTPVFILASIASILLGAFLATSIMPALFLSIKSEAEKARDIIYTSRIYMKGLKKDYFKLCLTCIPWLALTVITCGIASFYTIPYLFIIRAKYFSNIGKKEILKPERKKMGGFLDDLRNRRDDYIRLGRKDVREEKEEKKE